MKRLLRWTVLAAVATILIGIGMPFLLLAQYYEPAVGMWPFFISVVALPLICGYFIENGKLSVALYAIASIIAISIGIHYMTTLFSTPGWIEIEWAKKIWKTYNQDMERATIAIPLVIAIHTLEAAPLIVVAKLVAMWQSEPH